MHVTEFDERLDKITITDRGRIIRYIIGNEAYRRQLLAVLGAPLLELPNFGAKGIYDPHQVLVPEGLEHALLLLIGRIRILPEFALHEPLTLAPSPYLTET